MELVEVNLGIVAVHHIPELPKLEIRWLLPLEELADRADTPLVVLPQIEALELVVLQLAPPAEVGVRVGSNSGELRNPPDVSGRVGLVNGEPVAVECVAFKGVVTGVERNKLGGEFLLEALEFGGSKIGDELLDRESNNLEWSCGGFCC